MIPARLLSFLFFAGVTTASAQFQVVGPAPISATVARRQIRTLLEQVTPDNTAQTVKKLSALTPWFRDTIDQELIAAWSKDDRTNLPPVIEPLADPRVAAGIVELSWRQQRDAVFTPVYAPMLGRLMSRYPDSAKPFLDDLLNAAPASQRPLDLTPTQVEAVCRILIDMPDVGNWKKSALQILTHYRQEAQKVLAQDQHSDDSERRERAYRWLAALTPPDSAAGTLQRRAAAPSGPTILTKVEPQYSALALKLHVQDSVSLRMVVSPEGIPGDFQIVKSVGYGLDEKAIEAVQQWRFAPATRNGKAVPVTMKIDVGFRRGDLQKSTWWAAGPMVFAAAPGVTPPTVLDGTLPKPGKDSSDESVVLEFTVGADGAVRDIRAVSGSQGAAEFLARSLATWTFQPAHNASGPVEACGRVRLLKGGQADAAAKAPLIPPIIR